MIVHYIINLLRNIRRNKTNYFISIFGLALGMLVSFIVLIYVLNEISYDDHYPNNDRIFRVLSEYPNWQEIDSNTPYILGPTLLNDFPEIKSFTRTKKISNLKIRKDNSYILENSFQFADNSIFNIFSIPFIIGSPQEALNQKNSVVISERMAKKYFNIVNPIGQTLKIEFKWGTYDLIVTGVIENISRHSTLQADFIGNILIPVDYLNERFQGEDIENGWTNIRFTTYVFLRENTSLVQLEKKLLGLSKKHSLENFEFVYSLQNLSDIYLGSSMLTSNNTKTGSLTNIYIFSLISILILVISGSNSIILYIAHSSARYKEFGIRKIFGSNKNLVKQVFIESILLNFFALPLVIIFLLVIFPYLNIIFNYEFFIETRNILKYTVGFLLIVLSIGGISGLIGSQYFLNFNSIDTLKNKIALGKKKLLLNRVLIVIQIIIFSGLFATLLFINRQIGFVKNETMGFNENNLIIIKIDPDEFKDYVSFRDELKNIALVKNVTGGWGVPPNNNFDHDLVPAYDNPDREVIVDILEVDYDFLETYQIPLVAGNDLSSYEINDSIEFVLINETAINSLALDNPIGKTIDDYYKIVGIVRDFYIHSMHERIKPAIIYRIDPKWIHEVVVRINQDQLDQGIYQIKKKWNEFAITQSFEYDIVTNIVKDLYTKESNFKKQLILFSIIGIVLSSLGLFGLSLFLTKKRTKEIGVRKVNGASVFDILSLLTKEFIKMVFLANLISLPIVYLIVDRWLENFHVRISILNNLWIFAITIFISAIIVILSIGIKSLQAANANPVESLKLE